MDIQEINEIFQRFSCMRVLVIGDVMVDSYYWGNVERVSPEAPIPVVAVTKQENRLGGAANVALNLKELGAEPVLCSVVGCDQCGRQLKKMVSNSGMEDGGIVVDPERITTLKSRIIGKGQHIARIDEESTKILNFSVEEKLKNKIKIELEKAKVDIVVIVDYDKGVMSPELFYDVRNWAKKCKTPVVVDPKKRNFDYYDEIDLFKPNFKEFIEGTGIYIERENIALLAKSAAKYRKIKKIKNVFITLSELGVLYCDDNGEYYFPATVKKVADVSGAGDSVMAVVALAWASRLSGSVMGSMANIAGGLVCEAPGVVPIDKKQFVKLLEKKDINSFVIHS